MFPILRQHWTLWALWTLAGATLLFASPFSPFGWAELVASVGALVLSVDRRTRRETLLAVGLPSIALLAIVASEPNLLVRLALDWFVFIGATLLGARAVDDQRELEEIAGHIALGPDPSHALELFRTAVVEEIARSRRHERAFSLLSVAVPAHARTAKASEDSFIASRLAGARWGFELAGGLKSELHRYARVVATDRRTLCLVPELDAQASEHLATRIRNVIRREFSIEVDIGMARFPEDALGVGDLIEAADEGRTTPKLERVPDPADPEAQGGGDELRDESDLMLRDAKG